MNSLTHKKILFVITKSNWGGAQRYVYDLATALPKDKFEVAVALGGNGELARKLEEAGIRIIPLSNLQRDLSLSADAGGLTAIKKAIREFLPDVVHLNSSKAGGLGALAARLLGVRRIVFTAHGWPFLEKRSFLWRAFAYLGSWATALLSHKVIVISKNDLAIGKRMPFCAHKMQLVYNGIKMPDFGSGEVIRNAFPPGVKITGTVGELTKNKNQIFLVEAARIDPEMYVAIVGAGEERARLGTKIREYGLESRVKLFGFLPATEVMKGFDEFVLPSHKEGLPYVLLEARAAGLPIKANRVGGVGEILDHASDFAFPRMLQETIHLYQAR